MIRRIPLAILALLVAIPLSAQAPAGMMMRVDASTNPDDPDDNPEVTVTSAPNGYRVSTGPAAVLFNPQNTATGAYTLRGTYTMEEPASHRTYYGLVFGGGDITGANQHYLYFCVAQTGEFIIGHRENNETVTYVERHVAHDAVATPDANGRSVNALEVRIGANQVDFVINGTVVTSQPRTGALAATDGIWGSRINHVLPSILVENLSVTPGG